MKTKIAQGALFGITLALLLVKEIEVISWRRLAHKATDQTARALAAAAQANEQVKWYDAQMPKIWEAGFQHGEAATLDSTGEAMHKWMSGEISLNRAKEMTRTNIAARFASENPTNWIVKPVEIFEYEKPK